jgi:hypothetical protein
MSTEPGQAAGMATSGELLYCAAVQEREGPFPETVESAIERWISH